MDDMFRILLQEAGRIHCLHHHADYKGNINSAFTMYNLVYDKVLLGVTGSLSWSGRRRRAAGAQCELRALEMPVEFGFSLG